MEPWLRRLLRALVVVGFLLVAVNFCLRWWFFESRAHDPRFPYSSADLLAGRLALVTAAALLTGGCALWELLGTLPRVTRRTRACLAAAALLAAIPQLVALWLAARR